MTRGARTAPHCRIVAGDYERPSPFRAPPAPCGTGARRPGAWILVVLLGLTTLTAEPAWAHGLAGNRLFPATLAIDDPFVADELAFPSFSRAKDSDKTTETDFGMELAKTITPNFQFSIGGTYVWLEPSDSEEGSTSGFDNPEVGLKYLLFRHDPSETLISVGLNWEIGGVGSSKIDAASFSTLSPALFFGQGLGVLPEAVSWLRPLAVTGTVGADVPTKSGEGNHLTYGFTIQYSLVYLQSYVKDVGLPAPFNRMIPLVEFAFDTPLDGPDKGPTTGTINPGLVWVGKYFQIGAEAIVPMNGASGRTVGVRALLDIFLDDLFPKVFKPLFSP
jgi:hypothetical protein